MSDLHRICTRSETAVRCAVGTTESFKVKVGLYQGSALSPFLFAVIIDRLTDEVRREPLWMMLFADNIAICRDQGRSTAETRMFEICTGKKRDESRSKTEYLCVMEEMTKKH